MKVYCVHCVKEVAKVVTAESQEEATEKVAEMSDEEINSSSCGWDIDYAEELEEEEE